MSKIISSTGRALLAPAMVLIAALSVCAQDASRAAGATQDSQSGAAQKGALAAPQSGAARAPLTADKKISRAFRHAFFSPVPYATSALSAAYTEWRDDKPPAKTTGDAFADWGSRTARNFATGSTKALFAYGFYPALLRQDPRYESSQSKKRGERLKHAVSRVFVTRGDNGSLQPNYSLLAGDMTASAMANIWEHSTPDHNRIGTGPTFQRFGWQLVDDAINNVVFREFGPDIKKIFKH
ncbi:MAG TPA: hypothetical protein VFA21_22410 [Pyrinomonadaceae bacterium]|nr:hypothetical protein [Pyrinomonadaceae bacterium]